MKSLLQTQKWADLKVAQGWKSHNIDGVFVLEKPLALGKSFLYAPEVEWASLNLQKILQNLEKNSQICCPIFFRLEILDEKRDEIIKILKENKFIKAFEELQPEWRQVIDISKSEEEILAQMKEKGRYNIRIAQRNNVVAKISTNIDDFYKIFIETAKRDGFSIRPRKYFEDLLKNLGENIALLVAEFQGKIIAAELVTFFEATASYLYGASSSENRNVMAPYLLHWQAILEAKKKGCKAYDLLAVSPPETLGHKYAGLTRFKEQFGGKKVNIVGSYDLIYKPVWYKLFKFAEQIRR